MFVILSIAMSSGYHNRLVSIVKYRLQSEGLRNPPFRIYEEYPVKIKGRRYKIDIVAFFGDGRKVAVECGSTSLSKLDALKEVFDEVKIFDFPQLLDEVEKVENKHFEVKTKYVPVEEYEKLKKDYNDLKENYDVLCREYYDMQYIGDFIPNEKRSSVLQIRCTEKTFKAFKTCYIKRNLPTQEHFLVELLKLFYMKERLTEYYEKAFKIDISVVPQKSDS